MTNMENKTNTHKREPLVAFTYNNVEYFDVNITGAKCGHVYTEDEKKVASNWMKVSRGTREYPSSWLRKLRNKKSGAIEIERTGEDGNSYIEYYEEFRSTRSREGRIFIKGISLVSMARMLCTTFYVCPENGDFEAEHIDDKKHFPTYMDANWSDNVIPLSMIAHQGITNKKNREEPQKKKDLKVQQIIDMFKHYLDVIEDITEENSAYIREKNLSPTDKISEIKRIKSNAREKLTKVQ